MEITSKFEDKEQINFLSEDIVKVPHAVVESETVEEELVEKDTYDFTHYELHDALLWIEDIFERGLVNWVLLGDLALQLKEQSDPTLKSDKIEIAVLRKNLTKSGRSMAGTWLPDLKDENLTEIKANYEGVPIYIKIIDEDPGYLSNPDKRFYYVSDIYLPNPFEEYEYDRDNQL